MRLGTPSLKQAALFIYVPSILMSLGQGMLIPALPELGATFGVSSAVAVQALTAQLIGRAVALIPAGGAIDRWGAKPVMVGGALLATGSALVAAGAPTFLLVLAAQFTWGIGMSIWMFGREIAAFDMVRADQRGRQMSALMGFGSAGMAFGPAVGGVLTDLIGVRPLFLVYAGSAAFVVVTSMLQKNTSVHRERKPGGFLRFDAIKRIHPYYRLTYLILFFSTFGQMVRSQVTNSALPLYTQDQLGMSPTLTGLIFTVMATVTFAMIVPTGFISDKIGRKWAAAPAAVFSFVGFILVPLFDTVPLLMVAVFVIGLANGLAMGAMTIYTFDIAPGEVRGQLQALRRSIGETGAMLSPPIVGVLTTIYGPSSAFWATAPLHGISALLLIFVARESLRRHVPSTGQDNETNG